jgi:uncharacterized repeat protein (TIGR03803 family)
MRLSILFSCALCTLLSPAVAAAQECYSRTVVFFVNGLDNDPAKAEASRLRLEEVIDASVPLGCEPPIVMPALNNTSGMLGDLVESYDQLVADDPSVLWWVIGGGPLGDAGRALGDKISTWLTGVDFSAPVDPLDVDLASHLAQYRAVLDADYRVVVVSHSQGNLFANKAIDVLLEERGLSMLESFRIVAVATPASRVGTDSVPYVTLDGDWIHRIQGGPLGPLQPNVFGVDCGSVWQCHSFGGSYLKHNAPRERIVAHLKAAFNSNIPPVARLQLSANGKSATSGQTLVIETSQSVPIQIAFDASSSSDIDGHVTAWEWRVDGSIISTAEQFVTDFNQSVNTRTVSLTVTDDVGRSSSTQAYLRIVSPLPVAAFTLSAGSRTATNGQVLTVYTEAQSAVVTFDASQSFSSEQTIVSWLWIIDGVASSDREVFTATVPVGTHVVGLRVTDSLLRQSALVTATVRVGEAPLGSRLDLIARPPEAACGFVDTPVETPDGTLFGLTRECGGSDPGKVIRVDPSGTATVFFDLSGRLPYGSEPRGIALGTDGWVYGVSRFGGAHNRGTVFRVRPDTGLQILHSFSGGRDGAHPWSPPILGSNGQVYGAAQSVGSSGGNSGTVFQVSSGGGIDTIFEFSWETDGFAPSGFSRGADGSLFGVTQGITVRPFDTTGVQSVFRISTSGTVEIVRRIYYRYGSLGLRAATLHRDGRIYLAAQNIGNSVEYFRQGGGLLRFIADEPEEVVHYFTLIEGTYPGECLVSTADGLYGTNGIDGPKGGGTLFRVGSDGVEILQGFDRTEPIGHLPNPLRAGVSMVLGSTRGGGIGDRGTVFSLAKQN